MFDKINWTKVGIEYNGTDTQKQNLINLFDSAQWLEVKPGLIMSFMTGEGIKAAIKALKLPRVSHVCDLDGMGPAALYGIRAHYANAKTVDVFIIDEGYQSIPVCTVVHGES